MPSDACTRCGAKCCRYLALEIDKPRDRRTREHIRWYLSHRGVQVFVEKGRWYLQVATRCRHLDAHGRCSTYADRPAICRSYVTDNCEGTDLEYGYKLLFRNDAEWDAYLASMAKRTRPRAARRKRSGG